MTDRRDDEREPERETERPRGEDIELPEEEQVDGATVEADTASGGAPEPA